MNGTAAAHDPVLSAAIMALMGIGGTQNHRHNCTLKCADDDTSLQTWPICHRQLLDSHGI
jgi:hypothetical protein